MPWLPMKARHLPFHADVGVFVDLWFCMVAFGVVKALWRGKTSSQAPQ